MFICSKLFIPVRVLMDPELTVYQEYLAQDRIYTVTWNPVHHRVSLSSTHIYTREVKGKTPLASPEHEELHTDGSLGARIGSLE